MPAVASKNKQLRSGCTTGACAAAAAKAAALLLLTGSTAEEVDIPFPDGSRHGFRIERSGREGGAAFASVVKDAGDDPDVTHGAEIVVRAAFIDAAPAGDVVITGGEGVGVVTRPGLAATMGEAAINPVPRAMIGEAVREANACRIFPPAGIEATVSVPNGKALADKTLNSRLGIVGGISILGTTGIVRPLSSEAWTATISASMSVAAAMGRKEIVIATGRSSEAAHMAYRALPEECYVMMGDYVEYSLLEAKKRQFDRVWLAAQWAKMLKIGMATPQTHVSRGVIDLNRAAAFIGNLGFSGLSDRPFTTAREMFEMVSLWPENVRSSLFSHVCKAARRYAESIAQGIPVSACLVSYKGEVVAEHG